jgi:LPXTG-motif cell wall-anchored protein
VSIPNVSILTIATTTTLPSLGSIPNLSVPAISVPGRGGGGSPQGPAPCDAPDPGVSSSPGGSPTPGGGLANTLPQTGTSSSRIVVLALLLVVAGCPLLLVRRSRR